MPRMLTLFQPVDSAGVSVHSDILDPGPSVLSIRRGGKIGADQQQRMRDCEPGKCRLCLPELLEGRPVIEELCGGRVGAFPNAAPYLPYEQKVLYLYHSEEEVRRDHLHIFQMKQTRKAELYWLLNAMVGLGSQFAQQPIIDTDLRRMVAGFNFGPMAGQSLQHIHAQYGWEIFLEDRNINPAALQLFFSELESQTLILHESKADPHFMLVAPWTPRGQYALDLYFLDRYEIHTLTEDEIRVFAHVANLILQRYVDLNICNVNVVFDSSPLGRRIVPVRARFVPRVNKPAIYEALGRDVVDTTPHIIFSTFRDLVRKWDAELFTALGWDPVQDYDDAVNGLLPIAEPELPPA